MNNPRIRNIATSAELEICNFEFKYSRDLRKKRNFWKIKKLQKYV
jgi:hypothetical protein